MLIPHPMPLDAGAKGRLRVELDSKGSVVKSFRTRRKALLVSALLLMTGCSIEQEISRTPRTAVEQLLLTQAVERALTNLTIRIPDHAGIQVDVTGLYTDRARLTLTDQSSGIVKDPAFDFLFVKDTVAVALGRKGYRLQGRESSPPYLARISVESLGTMQGLTFIGMPPVQSVLLPFALPELTLYKHQKQSGYARLHIDVFDHPEGEYLGSTATMIGRTLYDQYTVFFFITWTDTDITAPP